MSADANAPVPNAGSVVTRFAPSPSGDLHVGGARTALYCWAFARRFDGRFILRIEDTDRKRSSGAAALGFLRDLEWLGIDWDEGPTADGGTRGDAGPYFQSERLPIYTEHLERLVAEGKAYHAFDSAEELDAKRTAARAAKTAYRYDRAALALSPDEVRAKLDAGEPSVIRFRSPDRDVVIRDEVLGEATIPAGEIDDFVIRKADGFPTYHFAVVVDDALMGVTHVLRAQEHFNNTAKHLLLQEALGFDAPVYGHVSLIMNPDGSKMSKRDKDKAVRTAVKDAGLDASPVDRAGVRIVDDERFTTWLGDKTVQLDLETLERLADALGVQLPEINVADFRRSGYLPEVLVNFLALNGWSPGDDLEKFDGAFLASHFGLDRVVKTPARFDRVKLLAFNLDALQAMSVEDYTERVRDHGAAFHPSFMERLTDAQFDLLAAASHERSKTLDDLFTSNRFLLETADSMGWPEPTSKPIRKALTKGEPTGLELLASARPAIEAIDEWTVAGIEPALTAWAESHCDGNLGRIAQPLRIALAGGPVSPPIFDTLAILGKDETLARIDGALAFYAAQAAGG